jgi:hypothetical protein
MVSAVPQPENRRGENIIRPDLTDVTLQHICGARKTRIRIKAVGCKYRWPADWRYGVPD